MDGNKNNPSFGKKLRGYFAAGLLVLIPLVLTVYIVWQLFVGIDGLLNEYVTMAIIKALHIDTTHRNIPGLGLLALVILIVIVGFIARNYFGKKFISLGDSVVNRIPAVRQIYSTIQQISQAFLADKSDVFKKTALFQYPRKGIYSIGFITQDTKGWVQDSISEDTFSIFLPTTPNPTSGFLLFVPKKDVTILDIPVEEALKLIISGGTIIPQGLKIPYSG